MPEAEIIPPPDKKKSNLAKKLNMDALAKTESAIVMGETFALRALEDNLIEHQADFPAYRDEARALTDFDKLRESAQQRDKKMFAMINEGIFSEPKKAISFLVTTGYSIDGAQKTYLAMLLTLRDFYEKNGRSARKVN